MRSLCEDHEGNIWIATGAGLNALRPRKVQMLNPPDAWQGRAVLSFVVGRAGDVWVGTEGAGLYHRQGDQWTPFHGNQRPDQPVRLVRAGNQAGRAFCRHVGRRVDGEEGRPV